MGRILNYNSWPVDRKRDCRSELLLQAKVKLVYAIILDRLNFEECNSYHRTPAKYDYDTKMLLINKLRNH